MILFEKCGAHQPLNRQAERYAREGVDISLSTLAEQVGACTAALAPLHRLIEALVLAAERLHGDDTTVPVLARTKTDPGRLWTYVRDDRPWDGRGPPARCSDTRATGAASTCRRISPPGQGFCRPTPIAVTTRCSAAPGRRSPARSAGRTTHAGCSSSPPTLPPSSSSPRHPHYALEDRPVVADRLAATFWLRGQQQSDQRPPLVDNPIRSLK